MIKNKKIAVVGHNAMLMAQALLAAKDHPKDIIVAKDQPHKPEPIDKDAERLIELFNNPQPAYADAPKSGKEARRDRRKKERKAKKK